VRYLVLLASIALSCPWSAAAQRLPSTVVPSHYALWLAPDLQAKTFRGRETIRVDVRDATPTITLNAAEIEFETVRIRAGRTSQVATVALDAEREQVSFTVATPIPRGPADIEITYTGHLNDKLRGFYLSKTATRSYAVSQMEATDARRAFPSFDEPAFKATFDIALMIDTGDIAISNGRAIADRPGPEPGKHTVTFATTPKMSTYLVALLVGDFKCRAGEADGIPIRVCATPDKAGLTGYALDAAEREVKFYNQYFGIKYPFGKLDLVGIPDFSAGAMENAGAITFRERALLVDPSNSASALRRTVVEVTAHEIAHQWFGDLVTMRWWDDIWLNEGIATWMEKKAMAALEPSWHAELAEAQDTQSALGLDALRTTRPIRTSAESPDDINALFDGIAYEKTAAVLRMIEQYVGPESFRRGVTAYLRAHAYANATGEDFWNELTRVTRKPVDRIMTSFVEQPGAPVLTVRNSCSESRGTTTVTQQRFFETPPSSPASSSASRDELWTFPACFKTAAQGPRCELIERREQTFPAESCDVQFANAASRGYYLTDYTPDAVRALAARVGTLALVERIGLLGDEWRIMRAGRHRLDVFLDLASAMSGDDTAAVIDGVADRVEQINDRWLDPSQRPQFADWTRTRFGPTLARLGIPGSATEDDNRLSLRATLIELVGITGNDPEVQRQARDLARRYLADAGSLPATIASPVLHVAAFAGDAALYDAYREKLSGLAGQPEQYYRYFNALAWFRDPALVQRTLAFVLTPAVRSQDVGALIGALMSQPWSQDAAWQFVRDQWTALTSKLDPFQGIPALVGGTGGFCSMQRADEVQTFFEQRAGATPPRVLQRQLERIRSCAAARDRDADSLRDWLARATTSGTTSAPDPDSLRRPARP
jgi:aminopeptidase N